MQWRFTSGYQSKELHLDWPFHGTRTELDLFLFLFSIFYYSYVTSYGAEP